jgi:ABC-2 type transport system ATP-binding protein
MIEANNLVLFGKNASLRLKIPELKFHSPGITALVGHNGAGKSSLLRVVAGLEKPSLGSISYEKKDIYSHYEELKDKIHLLSWGLELYRNLSAKNHLDLFRSICKNWNISIENEILKDLAIPTHKKVEKMSRGEQVRLRLLLSLPRSPRVILLDEVTNDLDTDSRRAIFKKLDAYSFETGAQVVVATNMIEDIERYATDIILLQRGEVILQNSLDIIKEQHNTSFEEIIRIYERKEVVV